MFGFIGKIFGTSNDRNLKRMQKFVDAINSLDEDYSSKEDSFYRALKSDLSKKFSQNNDLYSILPEAFAAVREAGKRTKQQPMTAMSYMPQIMSLDLII